MTAFAPAGPYLQGYIDGLTAYAHWANGVQFVGACGTTLKKAIEEISLGIPHPLDEKYAKMAKAHEALVKHLRWINDIIATACDGGDAWCSIRDRPGASEWSAGMEALLDSLGFPAGKKGDE